MLLTTPPKVHFLDCWSCSQTLWLISGALPQIYIFHIYTGTKFTQIPDLLGTHIYTAQIYTNPFPHIDSKKPKFTQPKFTQNPNLHNPTLHITQIYTKLFLQILLKLYKVNSIINPGKFKKDDAPVAAATRIVRGVAAHRTTCILPRNVGVSKTTFKWIPLSIWWIVLHFA